MTAEEVSAQLDFVVSAHTLRKWARLGRIPGAWRSGGRVFFPKNAASYVIVDLSAEEPATDLIRIAKPLGDLANGTTR